MHRTDGPIRIDPPAGTPTPAVGPSTPPPSRDAHRAALVRRRRRRAIYSLLAIAFVLLLGTAGFQALTGSGWVNAFYFESMLATGQGPPSPLTTDTAKLFASAMAFLSVGTVVTTLFLNLGPWLLRLWREGIETAEREIERLEHRPGAHAPPGAESERARVR